MRLRPQNGIVEDDALCSRIFERRLGVTVCPVSNRFMVQTLTCSENRGMLRCDMKATINWDDPACFRAAYLNENLQAMVEEAAAA